MYKTGEDFIFYKGSSMHPTLRPMDKLKVAAYNGKKIRKGDVIVFVPANNHDKITHRVSEVNRGKIRKN